MNKKKRRIFISDIHMGIGEGLVGKHPYGWLHKDRAKMLAHFLDSLSGDNSVDELIVVGDLFDEWVMPFFVKSPAQNDAGWFDKIAEVEENADILMALSDLAARAKVSYVHGNHDMQMTKDNLAAHAPGVQFIPGGPGIGTYLNDGIHAEHGSLYCLFNAPYLLSGDPNQQIPIGYFSARSNARFVSKGGILEWDDYLKMFIELGTDLLVGEKLAQALLKAMAKGMDIHPEDKVHLYGVDDFTSKTTTIGEMADSLGNVYDEWDKEWKEAGIKNVSALFAIVGDTGHLYYAAKQHFTSYTNLVVFGHTHKWELSGVAVKDLEALKKEMESLFIANLKSHEVKKKINEITDKYDPGEDIYEGHVYANSGTWINGTGGGKNPPPATYVEVIDQSNIRTVHVKEYGIEKPLKTRRIYLGK